MSITDDEHQNPGPSPRRFFRAFGEHSENVAPLREKVEELRELELMERKILATRFELLAEVEQIACREAVRENASAEESTPTEWLGKASRDPRDTLAHRAARAELATALRLTEYTIDRHLMQAAQLTTQYTDTVATLKQGDISRTHATIMLDVGLLIGEAVGDAADEVNAKRAAFETEALGQAVKMTPNRFRVYLQKLVEEYAQVDLDTRFAEAWQRRDVTVRPADDGMAEVRAYIAAIDAKAIESRLAQIAELNKLAPEPVAEPASEDRPETDSSAEGDDECADTGDSAAAKPKARLIGEFRADAFTDLLLSNIVTGSDELGGVGITGQVQLVTHDSSLKQKLYTVNQHLKRAERVKSGEPSPLIREPFPDLFGYGPIPKTKALTVMATSTPKGTPVPWTLVVAHPETGDVLSVDRYQPSEAMRRFIAARDVHCRFPGCRVAVHRCDIDHTIDAALGGATTISNLGALCRGHHVLKHNSGWQVRQHESGVYEWTSLVGDTHVDEPVSRVTMAATGPNPAKGPPKDLMDDANHPF